MVHRLHIWLHELKPPHMKGQIHPHTHAAHNAPLCSTHTLSHLRALGGADWMSWDQTADPVFRGRPAPPPFTSPTGFSVPLGRRTRPVSVFSNKGHVVHTHQMHRALCVPFPLKAALPSDSAPVVQLVEVVAHSNVSFQPSDSCQSPPDAQRCSEIVKALRHPGAKTCT